MEIDDVFDVIRQSFDPIIDEKEVKLYIEFSGDVETCYMASTQFHAGTSAILRHGFNKTPIMPTYLLGWEIFLLKFERNI
jgi:hypothetical protein